MNPNPLIWILVVGLTLEPTVHGTPVEHVPEENHPTTPVVVNGGQVITSSFYRHSEVHQVRRDWSLSCSGSL